MKECIETRQAPAAVGAYSQAVKITDAGSTAYISGQIPLDPQSGSLVEGGIEAQTRRVLDNLQAVAEACGSSMHHVLKVSIYITDMDNFSAVNAVYGEYFAEDPPARACVEVSALPKGAGVEMEAVVHCPLSTGKR